MRILVVNDNGTERGAIVRTLRKAGYDVQQMADVVAAAEIAALEPPNVIVLGWPPPPDADVAGLLNGGGSSQTYVVVVLDQSNAGRSIKTLLAAGADDFLIRPIITEELIARVEASRRLHRWATFDALDWSSGTDLRRLRVWRSMGVIVAARIAILIRKPVSAVEGWPKRFLNGTHGATIALSLASEQTEARISIAVDRATESWLAELLLHDRDADEATVSDMLREMANAAGGGFARAALLESVTLNVGMPVDDALVRPEGKATQSYEAVVDGGKASIGIVGKIVRRRHVRVPAAKLREGMIVVRDVRQADGVLLVAAGTRLSATAAESVARALGEDFVVEIADAA